MTDNSGERSLATLVRATNSGVMTLTGTNTWVLRDPRSSGVVVVDPGPLDEIHLNNVLAEAQRDGGRVQLVIYSHWHADHTEAIDRFFEMTGAPARAIDESWCRSAAPVTDEEEIVVDALRLRILATPGHTSDSLCVLLPDEGSLLSADTVLGSGTTVVAHPDGNLSEYLSSLHRLTSLAHQGVIKKILPGHGPVITEPTEVLRKYLAHRNDRLSQVKDALAAGAQNAEDVLAAVYTGLTPELRFAALMSIEAQLDYIRARRPVADMER